MTQAGIIPIVIEEKKEKSKYLGWTWPEWKRILQHSPIGIMAFLFLLLPVGGTTAMALWTGIFVVYQAVQEYNRRGNSHVDIAGVIAGYPIGALLLWLLVAFAI